MADTLDVLTLAEGQAALNITSADDQAATATELAQAITAASRLCDSVYGPIVTRAFTKTIEAPSGRIKLSIPVASPSFAITFTSVTEYTSGTATVLTAETASTAGTYRWYSAEGVLARRSSFTDTYWGSQEVVIVGTWGRYANTASVDEAFKEAGAAALQHFWQHRGAQSGFGTAGGDGAPFGGVPFSTDAMRKKLRAMLPEEKLLPGSA